jgi:hypothetical protein
LLLSPWENQFQRIYSDRDPDQPIEIIPPMRVKYFPVEILGITDEVAEKGSNILHQARI